MMRQVQRQKGLLRVLASKSGVSSPAIVRTAMVVRPMSSSKNDSTWVPTQTDLLEKVTTQALVHEISLQQMESSATVVPWFLKNMPAAYFNQIPESLRKQHLKAIQAIRDLNQSDLSLKIESKGEGGVVEHTYIDTHPNDEGRLNAQIHGVIVPDGSYLSRVKVYKSLDNELALNVFTFEPMATLQAAHATKEDAKEIYALINEIKAGKHADHQYMPAYSELFSEANMADYLQRVGPSYAKTSNPRRFLVQRGLFEQVRNTEGTVVDIEGYHGAQTVRSGATHSWITIAASNVLPEVLLRLSSNFLRARSLEIVRCHLDTVADPENAITDMPNSGFVTMLRLLVSPDVQHHSTPTIPQADFERTLKRELKRAKWLDDSTTRLGLVAHPEIGVDKCEIITALCSMLHGPLCKINPTDYTSIATTVEILEKSPHFMQQADAIAELFLDKFRPTTTHGGKPKGISAEEFENRASVIHSKLMKFQHESARILLLHMLEATRQTLRTNFFNEDRYALSMRVNPSIMVPEPGRAMPFGVFFVHGRHFNAFHCRFRDIARGGLRVVTPRVSDQYAQESSKQFDEAYGLSFAQQLKNKDIPEGGSKGVILVNSPILLENHKPFAIRKSIKAFADSLLDLIVKDSLVNCVDYLNHDELIYLGPDEQVIPFDIDWITTRAAQRGYPIPAAFMSSKKDAGFNHKVYGVTSEGVNVFLDVALRNVLNIDPHKDSFTMKITGGPDGDVAGNLMKIVFRDYGTNCKIVGVADGFGVAEDPKGLDHAELLRLFEAGKDITHFNPQKLSSEGVLFDAKTEIGQSRRATMPFRVQADVFVPAGGRPNTINKDNWQHFIGADGKPSSRLVVEGANIFNTPEARAALFKNAGVVFVKDSSANKCGVITSSCEIMASMLLSKEEFMANKEELVNDVIARLHVVARNEAELLFRAYKNFPGDLPHFSERISNAINKVTDAITDSLVHVNPGDPLFEELLPVIKETLPKKLVDLAWDRVPKGFPVQYQKNAIASSLASKLVYKEGIHLVESQPSEAVAERAFMYYREDLKIGHMCDRLESKDLGDDKKVALDLLRRGGARTSLGIF